MKGNTPPEGIPLVAKRIDGELAMTPIRPRDKTINLRLTEDERSALNSIAEEHGLKAPGVLRSLIVEYVMWRKGATVDPECYKRLRILRTCTTFPLVPPSKRFRRRKK